MGEGLTLAILAVQTFFKLLNFSFLPIGDFEHLSNINFEIANVFDNSGHHHKAVFYLLRSLENSKQAENGSHEAKVKFNLGKVNVKLGAYSNAITWFEEYLDFVKGKQDNEGLVLGSRKLLEVYELFAKRAQRKGQLHKGLELYQKVNLCIFPRKEDHSIRKQVIRLVLAIELVCEHTNQVGLG